MLRLFHSFFGSDDQPERYPDTLVRAAIERAVDGTDPWLRGLSGYRRKLRPAVVHAIDHVVALVEQMDQPLELSRDNYRTDPALRLFFISSEQMDGVLRNDPSLAEYRRQPDHSPRPTWALLTMVCEQRRIFGADLVGETIVRDVAQTTVGMAHHRLLDPAASPAECRRLLRRRAFDHLLALALTRIAAVEDEREELLQHRTLLQAKHDTLEGSSWGFGDASRSTPPLEEIHRQLDEIETQLLEVGGDADYIEKHLEILIDVLGSAEHQLWVQPLVLSVDRMGIRHSQPTADVPEVALRELHNADGRRLIARMVVVPPAA